MFFYKPLEVFSKLSSLNVALVSYSEIALKSPPVRRRMENQLIAHIRNMLDRAGLSDARVNMNQGRIVVRNAEPVTAALAASKIFGVASTMPAVETSVELKDVVEAAARFATRTIKPNQTFAIDARRVGKHPYTSRDVEVKVGAEVLRMISNKRVSVNLEDPDKTIHVEARSRNAYIYSQVYHGPGGLPFGSQGKLVSLFSGGIDSPVASWLMMKRGAYVIPLFLDQRPFVGDDYYGRAVKVARELREYVPIKEYLLYVIPIGNVMKRIVEKVPKELTCIICKRMMYRIACSFAELRGAQGVVTGESLGQVASQTLVNLKVLEEAAIMPIYRPLIGLNKHDSVRMARKIGTYGLSIAPVQGCSVVPKKPATMAKIDDVKEAEEKICVKELVSNSFGMLSKLTL